jgi:hypothetical protein
MTGLRREARLQAHEETVFDRRQQAPFESPRVQTYSLAYGKTHLGVTKYTTS